MDWNSKTLREEVERLDPQLKPGEPGYQAALMLLASVVVGPYIGKIERLTKVRPGSMRKFSARARKSGIWQRSRVKADWFAPKGEGAVSFWLDVNVCLGYMGRVR